MLHRSVSRSFVTGVAAVLAATLGAGPVTASPQQASASAPVPEGFRAQSLTWTSPARGWTLGTAPCEDGSEGDMCTTVVRTRDGGRSWSAAGTVESPIAPPGEPGVTDLDFADARHGWAYGPSLERTRDGGRTWSPAPLPGDGRQVVALVAEAGRVYAVVSPCEIGQPPFECTDPPTLWWAPAASGRWRPTGVALPVGASTVLAAAPGGRSVYVVGQMPPPTPDAFYATTDGRTWSPRPSPCDKEGNGDVLADVAPTSRRDVALLCVGSVGFSKAAKTVFRSGDGARTTTPAGITSEWGILSDLAATRDGTLAVASTSSGSWIYLNDGGADVWTTPVEKGDGGAGWNDLTFTTDDVGWVVYAPAAGFPGTGTLLTTADGGHTWSPVDLAPL